MKKLFGLPRRFAKDTSGTPAIEFAFIAPVFLLLFLGGFSAFDAMRGVRQTSLAASTLSDLATRVLSMDDTTRDAMFLSAESILGKYALNANVSITITSVVNELGDGDDDLSVAWSVSKVAGEELDINDFDSVRLPTITDGESIIHVVVSADYDPVIDIIPGSYGNPFSGLKMNKTSVRRPRFVTEVVYES